jgi:mannose-1-phosphate guanylyltransferase/mannose-1-phosphate guanylyltransferase/mannose-6-phosphate isomerase
MFQQTLRRVADRTRFAAPLIVANSRHADIVESQMAEIGMAAGGIILEPCARNTAPAIALASLAVAPDALILVMPSDQVIQDVAALHDAIAKASIPVAEGWLATFGIAATAPETGYGYIQRGQSIADGVEQVARFIEKPDAARAAEMVAAGDFSWNGGIFLFRARDFLDALGQFEPDMLLATQAAMAAAERDGRFVRPDEAAFAACPSNSIDYAVMERAEKVAVAPVSMGWSDVGSWDALYDLGEAAAGVAPIAIDTDRCLIRSDGIRVHTVGVSDLIIVAAGNDILILPRGESQNVRKIVEARARV